MDGDKNILAAPGDHQARLLSSMKDGASFFVPDARPEDLVKVRHLGYKIGVRLRIQFTVCDPIYGQMGTRVKRIGPYNRRDSEGD